MTTKKKGMSLGVKMLVVTACMTTTLLLVVIVVLLVPQLQNNGSSYSVDLDVVANKYPGIESLPNNYFSNERYNDSGVKRSAMNKRHTEDRTYMNTEDPVGIHYKDKLQEILKTEDSFSDAKIAVSQYVASIETDLLIAKYFMEDVAIKYATGVYFTEQTTEEEYLDAIFKLDYALTECAFGTIDAEYGDAVNSLLRVFHNATLDYNYTVHGLEIRMANEGAAYILDRFYEENPDPFA